MLYSTSVVAAAEVPLVTIAVAGLMNHERLWRVTFALGSH